MATATNTTGGAVGVGGGNGGGKGGVKEEDCIIESVRFYGMHEFHVEFERRPTSEIMPTEKIRSGMYHADLGMAPIVYDRLDIAPTKPVGNMTLEPGQIVAPVKMLTKMDRSNYRGESTPTFFFVFRNHDAKVEEYRRDLAEHYGVLEETKPEEFKVQHIMQVGIGGLFVIKDKKAGYYYRIRVTKLNLTKERVAYFAVDEGYFGRCRPTDLLMLSEVSAGFKMLAVPGVYETDPSEELRQKFEGSGACYRLAKILQPKYGFDFCPRQITLL